MATLIRFIPQAWEGNVLVSCPTLGKDRWYIPEDLLGDYSIESGEGDKYALAADAPDWVKDHAKRAPFEIVWGEEEVSPDESKTHTPTSSVKWLKITAGGDVETLSMPADYTDGLKPEYAAIGRGCFIVEMLTSPTHRAELWLDEEGKLSDPIQPPNLLATFLAGRLGIMLAQDEVIHGDVLVGYTLNKGNEEAEQRGEIDRELHTQIIDWRNEMLKPNGITIRQWKAACAYAGMAGRKEVRL